MGIKNKFIAENGLLVEILTGDVTFSYLSRYHGSLQKDRMLPLIKRVLSITTGANLLFSPRDTRNFIDVVKETTKDSDVRWAILTSTPALTALASLIEFDAIYRNKVLVCSLPEVAARFLEIPVAVIDLTGADFQPFESDS